MIIPEKEYVNIIRKTTTLCVDIIIRHKDQVLLVKRLNEPLSGIYWPVGGRVHKGETVEQAARRKLKEEIGINFKGDIIPIGYYEDTYTSSRFEENTSYSSFSLVMIVDLDAESENFKIKLDKDHDQYGYFDTLPERFVIKRFSDFADVLQY